ncbi:hypothetical protein AhaeAN59_04990 [Acinetobacter haemolyticus]|uniref:Uncharacterized protein n=1 Tax=Acinetobacter haemolyticus TaxID=29430 RepID=A0A2K8Q1N6_ACIHA|nr:hypothetical protein BSR56_11055 [Acinetobacter haemolyticus]QHI09505.1 hypothetical protein AhaeAN59_04990 [Acinetobacter haemolyticus]QHI12770.1 hypothetical protein AhaeAN43_04945 [Acinetobacter haemolyticus]
MKLAFFYNKNHIDIKDLKLLDSKNHDKKRKNTFLDKRSTILVKSVGMIVISAIHCDMFSKR